MPPQKLRYLFNGRLPLLKWWWTIRSLPGRLISFPLTSPFESAGGRNLIALRKTNTSSPQAVRAFYFVLVYSWWREKKKSLRKLGRYRKSSLCLSTVLARWLLTPFGAKSFFPCSPCSLQVLCVLSPSCIPSLPWALRLLRNLLVSLWEILPWLEGTETKIILIK